MRIDSENTCLGTTLCFFAHLANSMMSVVPGTLGTSWYLAPGTRYQVSWYQVLAPYIVLSGTSIAKPRTLANSTM